jgi:L-rhamnose mutarotase
MNPETDCAQCQPLKRFAFVLRLREGAAETWEQTRRNTLPEMRDMLKDGGISEYSIFRRDHLVFLTFKAVEFDATWSQFDNHPVKQRRQKAMAPFFAPHEGLRRTLPHDGGDFLSALRASDYEIAR